MPDRRSRLAAAVPWIAAISAGLLVTVILLVAAFTRPPSPAFGAGLSAADTSLIQLQQTSKRAPAFDLTDQRGHRIDLSGFRGRPVVLTFNDDECTDLCTLLAEDVVAADHDLGSSAAKIAFVSVNANPFHTSVGAVDDWTRRHGLGRLSNWYYGTASRTTLAGVAKRYGCDIEADAATGEVVHCTTIYFIDPSGVERALGGFGSDSADTAPFAHAMATMAVDLAGGGIHVSGSSLAMPTGQGAQIGDTAPTLDLPALIGDPPPPSDGRYRIVDFWSSTCSACRSQLPVLQREHEALGAGVDVVGVDVDDGTSAGRSFATSAGTTFASLRDADGATASAWRITGLPTLIVLDPHGRVLIRHAGTMTAEQLDYVIRDLDADLSPAD